MSIMFEFIRAFFSKFIEMNKDERNNRSMHCRTEDYFKVIKVTSSSTTSEVIAKTLMEFGLNNVKAEEYSLVEVLLISNVNYTDRVLGPNEYPLHVLRQQRKVRINLCAIDFV